MGACTRDPIGSKGNYVEVGETSIVGHAKRNSDGTSNCTWVAGAIEITQPTPKARRLSGRLRLSVVGERTSSSVSRFVCASVEPTAKVVTVDWSGYSAFTTHGYEHNVAEGALLLHVVFSNLKDWLAGIHHGVAPRHLQAYLNEFAFRFSHRLAPLNAFQSLLGFAASVTDSPTYDSLYSGDWKHPHTAT
jgi:hypothetical protein